MVTKYTKAKLNSIMSSIKGATLDNAIQYCQLLEMEEDNRLKRTELLIKYKFIQNGDIDNKRFVSKQSLDMRIDKDEILSSI